MPEQAVHEIKVGMNGWGVKVWLTAQLRGTVEHGDRTNYIYKCNRDYYLHSVVRSSFDMVISTLRRVTIVELMNDDSLNAEAAYATQGGVSLEDALEFSKSLEESLKEVS